MMRLEALWRNASWLRSRDATSCHNGKWIAVIYKDQTDYAFLSATYDFLLVLVFCSNYGAISHRNPVFHQITLIWPFKVTKCQTDYAILFATYDFLSVFHSNSSAISHGNPVSQQMTSIWSFKITKGQTVYAFRFATYDLLLVFYSNYSAISHGKSVFQQMTLIWPFKVSKGRTDYAIRFATYHFLYVFYSNYSAISHRNPAFRRWARSVLSVIKRQTDYPPASERIGLEFFNLFHSFYICVLYAKWIRLQRSIIIFYRRIYLSLAASRCKYWLILKF